MFGKGKAARRALRDVVEQVETQKVTRDVWVHLHKSLDDVEGVVADQHFNVHTYSDFGPDVRVESVGTIIDGEITWYSRGVDSHPLYSSRGAVVCHNELQLTPTDTWSEHKGWGYSTPTDREVGQCVACKAMEWLDVLDEHEQHECRDCLGRE